MKAEKNKLFIFLCVVPTLALTIIFMLVPAIKVFYMSFFDVYMMSNSTKFVGVDNYTYMFSDKYFYMALKNTGALMLIVPVITLSFSLIFAFILTQSKIKEKKVYRSIFFFSSIISLTVVAIVWSFVYSPNIGMLNSSLTAIGLESIAQPWLGGSKTALPSVGVAMIWQAIGYYMIMHIAAIDGIDPEIFEASTIDGATEPEKFIYIILPLLKNIIGITYVLALSGVLNISFVLVTIMTNGGPAGASSVLLQYMYTQAFTNANFGYAMAISVFTLAISFVLSILSQRISNKEGV